MPKLIMITLLLLIGGCTDSKYAEPVPLNIIDKSNELCQSMDGVKSLRISNDCVRSGKFCSNTLVTTAKVTCNKFDARVSIDIEWEVK